MTTTNGAPKGPTGKRAQTPRAQRQASASWTTRAKRRLMLWRLNQVLTAGTGRCSKEFAGDLDRNGVAVIRWTSSMRRASRSAQMVAFEAHFWTKLNAKKVRVSATCGNPRCLTWQHLVTEKVTPLA
jgi:hypothetical protein